ncbi:MAG: tyrosine-type recombinase/integrase [Deltaproteobacteria bacterium]|jgi:integrase/recombinase XerD|nr:tyrosine-type recombinase/integrase [Deltaproteobacteria bacterium]
MKPFESFLAQKIEEYVIYRLSLGFSLHTMTSHLRRFDRYLAMRNTEPTVLRPSFFLELRADLKLESRSINRILSTTRMFFQYLVRQGFYTANPVRDIPFLPENEIIPFIFSEKQIDLLLKAVSNSIRKNQRYFLKDLSGHMAILLLARCGMRISEPLKMKVDQYRPKEKTLYIVKTKFKKDRLIPVPIPVAVELENYLCARKVLIGDNQNPFLLAGAKQKRLNDNRVRCIFRQALKNIKIDQSRQVIGNINFSAPTVHSLRHSFAVNTLKRVQAQGRSPQNALPVMAAYMGHSEYKHTVKYLKMIDAKKRKQFLDFSLEQKEKR